MAVATITQDNRAVKERCGRNSSTMPVSGGSGPGGRGRARSPGTKAVNGDTFPRRAVPRTCLLESGPSTEITTRPGLSICRPPAGPGSPTAVRNQPPHPLSNPSPLIETGKALLFHHATNNIMPVWANPFVPSVQTRWRLTSQEIRPLNSAREMALSGGRVSCLPNEHREDRIRGQAPTSLVEMHQMLEYGTVEPSSS